MKKILIIGAGLSGLSTAYSFTKNNIDFVLFEKEEKVGGLCRSIKSNGFLYDHTGHLLHFSKKNVEELVKSFLKENLILESRRSYIYFKGKYIDYPFQQNLYHLPTKIKKECLLGYINIFFDEKKKGSSFYDWCLNNFGEGISKYFMIPYNEKLWKVKSKDMTTTWMKGYVPKPNIEEVLSGTFNEKKEGVGYNATFYYPKKGAIQCLPDSFYNFLDKKNVKLNNKIQKINLKNKFLIDANGDKYNYTSIVNSSPLKHLILNLIEDAPSNIKAAAEKLKHNIVLNINVGVNRVLTNKHWIYFPEDKFVFYRVGFSSNFSKYICPKNHSSIYTEVAVEEDFDYENRIEVYKEKVVSDLIKAKILESKKDIVDVTPLILNPAYVSYNFDRDKNVEKIVNYLEKNNIYSIGRFGLWEYSDMETAIDQGLKISDEIINGRK